MSGADWANGIASVIGSGLDFLGQTRANAQNKDIWKKTQDWTEMMSNTAWQRGVKDMKAAGINPMVAFSQGGASSPSGTVGTPMRSATAGMSHSAEAAGKAFSGAKMLQKQAANLDANTGKALADTAVAHEQKKLTANSAANVAAQTVKTGVDTVATEGTLKHLFGSVWDALKPSNVARTIGGKHSARSLRDFHD